MKEFKFKESFINAYNRQNLDTAIEILINADKRLQYNSAFKITTKNEMATEELTVFEIRENTLRAAPDNPFGLSTEMVITPWDILVYYKYKGNEQSALLGLLMDKENRKTDFIRVGDTYFKVTDKQTRSGFTEKSIIPFNVTETKRDAMDHFDDIPKFDLFNVFPDNINYQEFVGTQYNLWNKFPHERKTYENERQIAWTKILVEHVFGEQSELGYQYLKSLYENPKQLLPILALVSKERQTGKTTFINWLKDIFGSGATVLTQQDLEGSFTGGYANKHIIAIEESKFKHDSTIERIKNLSTAQTILNNIKYGGQYEVDFYGRFIVTSNDEDKFIRLDDEEIRFWVRKIPTVPPEFFDTNIQKYLADEIPYFLDYLYTRVEAKVPLSRMLFSAEELQTDTLKRTKKESRTWLEKELESKFDEWFANNEETEQIYFLPSQIKEFWYDKNSSVHIPFITDTLTKMGIEKLPDRRRREFFLFESGSHKAGYHYTIKNPYFNDNKILDENTKADLEIDKHFINIATSKDNIATSKEDIDTSKYNIETIKDIFENGTSKEQTPF